MKKLSLYLNKQIIFSLLIILIIVLGLDFIFSIFEGTGQLRSNFQLPQLIYYSLLSLFDSLIVFLPFVVLTGGVIGIARLKSTNELVIIQAAGYSKWKIVLTTNISLMATVFLVLTASEFWQLKLANYTSTYKFEKKWLIENRSSVIQESDIWLEVENSLVRIQLAREDGVLFGITQFEFDEENNLRKLMQATKAEEKSKYNWRLEDVRMIEFVQNGKNSKTQSTQKINSKNLPELNMYMPIDTEFISFSNEKARQMSLRSLYGYATYLEQKSSYSGHYWSLFWRKIFMPISIFLLVALGTSFVLEASRTKPLSLAIFKVIFLGIVFLLLQDATAPLTKFLQVSPFFINSLPVVFIGLWAYIRLRKI